MKIAGDLTIQDWKNLNKILVNTKNDNWGNAFNFFEERIKTRYLTPINAILKLDLNTGEGFAVVNLQCSLIETIESFYNGWCFDKVPNFYMDSNCTKIKLNGPQIFESFFSNRLHFNRFQINGKDFYNSVRCGLLHETQTKNGWKIKVGENLVYEEKDSEKIIYREAFQHAIEEQILEYKDDIIIKGNSILRINFRAKLNHICKQS